MNTIETTTYEYDESGEVVKRTVTHEEIPDGKFLRIDGLDEGRISDLVNIRDAFLAAGNAEVSR